MTLSRFNKFLIWKWYAEQLWVWSSSIKMKVMIDTKKVMRQFKENEKNLKYYYANKNNIGIKSTFKFKNIANNLIF